MNLLTCFSNECSIFSKYLDIVTYSRAQKTCFQRKNKVVKVVLFRGKFVLIGLTDDKQTIIPSCKDKGQ